MVGACECGDETPVSTKCREFIGQVRRGSGKGMCSVELVTPSVKPRMEIRN